MKNEKKCSIDGFEKNKAERIIVNFYDSRKIRVLLNITLFVLSIELYHI